MATNSNLHFQRFLEFVRSTNKAETLPELRERTLNVHLDTYVAGPHPDHNTILSTFNDNHALLAQELSPEELTMLT